MILTLTNIKTSRVSNRVNLIFSDGSYLPFFIDDVIKLSLAKNQSVDTEKLDLIKQTSLKYLGREYALRQIAISPKTSKILIQKLKLFFQKKRTDISTQNIIDEIISELESKKLLNQDDFVSYFINKNHHRSRTEIIFRLHRQGIDLSPQFLDKILPQNDSDLIKKFLIKKKIDPKDLKNFNYRQKIMASLFRRGFNIDNIRAAIDDSLKLK